MKAPARISLATCLAAVALLILPGGSLRAQGNARPGVVTRTHAEPAQITVGDLVHVVIEVDHPAELKVTLPEPETSLGSFEVRAVEALPPATRQGLVTSSWNLTVATFETGKALFPVLELTVSGDPQGSFSVTTDALELEVQSVLPEDAEDILDIKFPRPIPRAWWTYWPWPAAGLAMALLLWWLWRRRRRKGGISRAPRPLLPPDEEALAALRALESSDLLSGDQPKPFYTKVSDILRRYLWRRFGIVALEATTSEIVQQLTRVGAGEHSASAGSILHGCDLVKFAKLKPPRENGLAVILEARSLVQQSRPRKPALDQNPESRA